MSEYKTNIKIKSSDTSVPDSSTGNGSTSRQDRIMVWWKFGSNFMQISFENHLTIQNWKGPEKIGVFQTEVTKNLKNYSISETFGTGDGKQ